MTCSPEDLRAVFCYGIAAGILLSTAVDLMAKLAVGVVRLLGPR